MSVVVEFAGLPASGKSTLAEHLIALLRDDGTQVRVPGATGRIGPWPRRLDTALRCRGVLARAAWALLVRDSRPAWHGVKALQWLAVTLDHRLQAADRDADGSVVVLPEGVVQRALLVMLDVARGRVHGDVARYAHAIPVPDLLVRLDVDVATSVQRQQSRRAREAAAGRVGRAADRMDVDDPTLQRAMEVGDRLLDDLASHLNAHHGVAVAELDATNLNVAREGLATEVVPAVLALVRQGQPR